MNSEIMSVHPSVFAVENEYQICVLVKTECTMWVEVDNKNYYDHSNGVLRSGKFLHIAHIPQSALNNAKKYTVHLRRINKRKPYFTDFGAVEKTEYDFKPIAEKNEYHIINLADSHSLIDAPIRSGSYFGDELDLLILNGDIPNHSDNIEYFKAIYMISGGISKGRIPCIFSRGNHDMRGVCAEQLEYYTPTSKGKSYFTFSLGPIWGLVLDTAEDKDDSHEEYGCTVCCSAFREEESLFIEDVVASGEYKKFPVRLIISHNPFTYKMEPPFDIEEGLYKSWSENLGKITPTLMLTGHLHECFLEAPGGKHDSYGQPCALLCSSKVDTKKHKYTCGAVTITDNYVQVCYINDKGKITGKKRIEL